MRFLAGAAFVCGLQVAGALSLQGADQGCQSSDGDALALVQANMAVLDEKCEEMCKRLGIYPKCQCPGFEGNPASDGDTRKCIVQYCQDPNDPCPTDAFVACVKSATKISALQWSSLLRRVDSTLGGFSHPWAIEIVNKFQSRAGSGCNGAQGAAYALIQARVVTFDEKCEDMCKRLGVYPKCQCPGFEGNPSSDGDTRKCLVQYCQDPTDPCPTDAFVACVKSSTKISALQWPVLLQTLGSSVDKFMSMAVRVHDMKK